MVLVSSSKDIASMNMVQRLVERHGFTSTKIALMGKQVLQKDSLLLVNLDTELVHAPNLDEYFNPQGYVFLSRHRAESGIASLTVHNTGNFSTEAELGGRPRELGRVNPDLLKSYFIALKKRQSELKDYEVTLEATHHGPTSLMKPVMFVEIGSGESNWKDERAGAVVVDALMEALSNQRSWDKVALAFGGTHYPEKFNKLLLESDVALASVVAKYSLEHVDGEMFGQMIQKSSRSPGYAAIDWKGMGKHKEKILALARQFALEVMKL
jgi:D-aminoacyl-tRNA deacylase